MKKRICIYCGSRDGKGTEYIDLGKNIGQLLAQHDFDLVYGGAQRGVMGTVADSAMASGSAAIGVIPRNLFSHEIAHKNLTEIHFVKDMHERKMKMMELSDAFIALPGGFGTMDELNEIITWRQIGIHQKPIAIYNYNHFFDGFKQYIEHAIHEGFILQSDLDFIHISDNFNQILNHCKTELTK